MIRLQQKTDKTLGYKTNVNCFINSNWIYTVFNLWGFLLFHIIFNRHNSVNFHNMYLNEPLQLFNLSISYDTENLRFIQE